MDSYMERAAIKLAKITTPFPPFRRGGAVLNLEGFARFPLKINVISQPLSQVTHHEWPWDGARKMLPSSCPDDWKIIAGKTGRGVTIGAPAPRPVDRRRGPGKHSPVCVKYLDTPPRGGWRGKMMRGALAGRTVACPGGWGLQYRGGLVLQQEEWAEDGGDGGRGGGGGHRGRGAG